MSKKVRVGFRPALRRITQPSLAAVSPPRWLQISAVAVLAWSWLRSGPELTQQPLDTTALKGAPITAQANTQTNASASVANADRSLSANSANNTSRGALSGTSQNSSTPSAAAATRDALDPASTARRENAAFSLTPGLSTINVIVSRNDTLDRIFRRLKLNVADLASLRSLPGLKARLDSLRPGESLRLLHRDGELFGLERRLNESETLKVVRDDSGLKANVLQNPLETHSRTLHGVIDHSLFEAVEAAGGHDQTAVNLADIFGWDIDFVLDIQPGDSFVVTYQELYQDGTYVKDGPIQAATFVNNGREYTAVRYVDPDGTAHYYTPDGRSMHKAFLRAPVEFTRISSKFNSARYHPILNLIRAHKGVDYAAPIGTPVRAAGDGRIRFAGRKGGYGNVVEIEHSRNIVTVYGHLSRFAPSTRVGQHVSQGSVIAYVGMTGLATGPHLHYEYRVNGVFKNPQTVTLPDALPIEARWREDFVAKTAPWLASLEAPIGPALVAR
jgi:murein DD-endopeptidase MepM/ murein hydrolase activator NlpD